MAGDDRAQRASMSASGGRNRSEDAVQRRERRLGEFQASVRPRIAALTLGAPELEDLADSFPALLFALATGYGEGPARDEALALVLSGATLRQVADRLDLPVWLRRVPAGAFTEMLPHLPGDPEFSMRIGSFIPTDRRRSQAWLLAISDAYLAGGRDFALWLARNWSCLSAGLMTLRAGLVPAWYWYSSKPGTRANALLLKGWDARKGTSALCEDLTAWQKRIALDEWLGNGQLKPWIPDAQIGAYEFVTLRRVEDYTEAAAALDNCLEQYAARLANGVSSVARISRGGKIIAAIEIGLHDIDPTAPTIVQLRGHQNKRVGPELWRKAYDWLSHMQYEPFAAERLTPPAADRMAARAELWTPYITHFESHADPAGKVAAQRLKRHLLPKIKMEPPQAPSRARMIMPAVANRRAPPEAEATESQPTMLQRVRDHFATLTGLQTQDNELLRWTDAVDRLEAALRGRAER